MKFILATWCIFYAIWLKKVIDGALLTTKRTDENICGQKIDGIVKKIHCFMIEVSTLIHCVSRLCVQAAWFEVHKFWNMSTLGWACIDDNDILFDIPTPAPLLFNAFNWKENVMVY